MQSWRKPLPRLKPGNEPSSETAFEAIQTGPGHGALAIYGCRTAPGAVGCVYNATIVSKAENIVYGKDHINKDAAYSSYILFGEL
jgi:hypothetical protein